MKILKYTFQLPSLEIKNGELVENGTISETYTFTLLHKGVGIFEELAHKPLVSYLMEMNLTQENSMEKLLNKDFIPNLACASYVKIEGDKFHNNRATAEEFKKTAVYPKLTEDIEFIQKLVEMAMECINSGVPQSKEGSKGKNA